MNQRSFQVRAASFIPIPTHTHTHIKQQVAAGVVLNDRVIFTSVFPSRLPVCCASLYSHLLAVLLVVVRFKKESHILKMTFSKATSMWANPIKSALIGTHTHQRANHKQEHIVL